MTEKKKKTEDPKRNNASIKDEAISYGAGKLIVRGARTHPAGSYSRKRLTSNGARFISIL